MEWVVSERTDRFGLMKSVLMKDELENLDYGWIVWSLLMSIDSIGSRSDSHWEEDRGLDTGECCI
jgi:hypothetical protein